MRSPWARPAREPAIDCWIATAHLNAAAEDVNTTISPSPRFFTSTPPSPSNTLRSSEKWERRSWSNSAGVNSPDNAVEPTRSVNISVTATVDLLDDTLLPPSRQIAMLRQRPFSAIALVAGLRARRGAWRSA
jgi:hypothetical protein